MYLHCIEIEVFVRHPMYIK